MEPFIGPLTGILLTLSKAPVEFSAEMEHDSDKVMFLRARRMEGGSVQAPSEPHRVGPGLRV